jgi:hypothetical protein
MKPHKIFGVKDAGHIQKPLGLYAEVLYSSYTQERHREWAGNLPRYADEYGFTHINIHGAPFLSFLSLEKYPLVSKPLSEAAIGEIGALRSFLKEYKSKGMRITLGSAGVSIPAGFFDEYPDARNIHAGALCELLEDMAAEYFAVIPEADEFEIHLWEAMLVSDGHCVCPEMFYGGTERIERFFSYPFYSPEDFLSDIISAYGRGAKKAGKSFSLLTFSHYKWQEDLLIKAIANVDPSLPIVLDHKCQPGDWTPQRLTNNVLEAFPERRAAILFDGAGEYWGQSRVPYCYPEEISHRLQHALEVNPSIREAGMRVMWQFASIFGNYNEVNLYALSEFAKDPLRDAGEVFGEWAAKRFGRGAKTARRALERTNVICNKIFYVDGAWIFNHSVISDIPYLESHFVTFGKAMIEWNFHDFGMKGRLREAILRPTESTVCRILGDRSEALRLSLLSLGEVESDKNLFSPEEYGRLTYQLRLLADICSMAYIHMELFLRYWIEKVNHAAAPPDNAEQFASSIGKMNALADGYAARYGDGEPLINAGAMRSYALEIEKAYSGVRG